MPNVRPGRAKKRTLTFAALGLAPALVVGGLVVGGTDVLHGDIGLTADSPITLTGHGHGHGRGMGQWGAYGYAKKGWSADQILRHYYGNTTAGKVGKPDVTVTLTEKSSVNVHAAAGMRVGGQTVAPGQAVSLSGGSATITEGCGGAVVRTVPATQVDPINAGPNRPANELLTFCGTNEAYRGSIGRDSSGVINILHVDDYVKGVIPKESVPSWADTGGFEALKAQAVAARSYILSGLEQGRKMDNTQSSQMYHGVAGEDPRTSRAADATAGQIRIQNGKPAFTEFSASTGGYTAGGLFPAVVDDGDTIAPAHDWKATVSPDSIGAAFGVGPLRSFEVIEANGLGPEHGRAIKVRVVGANRTVEATGDEARVKLQLKSDWFSVDGQQTPPKIVKPPVGPANPGGGLLDLGPIGDILGQVIPGLSVLGAPSLDGIVGQIEPVVRALVEEGLKALQAKSVALKQPVNRYHSDNDQGSTGTVAAPELLTDGRGVHGLVQVIENGVLYFSPLTGVHALLGDALTEYLNAGGLQKLGFPTRDGLK